MKYDHTVSHCRGHYVICIGYGEELIQVCQLSHFSYENFHNIANLILR